MSHLNYGATKLYFLLVHIYTFSTLKTEQMRYKLEFYHFNGFSRLPIV